MTETFQILDNRCQDRVLSIWELKQEEGLVNAEQEGESQGMLIIMEII